VQPEGEAISLTTAPASRAGQALPRHLRPRREKLFGDGRPLPLDRNAKARVMTLARALMRRTEAGKHYGQVTAKAMAVLTALLWGFHNARSGLCFPSYKSIAARADCAPSTVGEAIKAQSAVRLRCPCEVRWLINPGEGVVGRVRPPAWLSAPGREGDKDSLSRGPATGSRPLKRAGPLSSGALGLRFFSTHAATA
jgi:hypothetical protein